MIPSGTPVFVAVWLVFFWSSHSASLEGTFDYLLSGSAKKQSCLLWTQLAYYPRSDFGVTESSILFLWIHMSELCSLFIEG